MTILSTKLYFLSLCFYEAQIRVRMQVQCDTGMRIREIF